MGYIQEIAKRSVDHLQVAGIQLINENGWRLASSKHGPAKQIANVCYILEPTNNTYDKVNSWRAPKSVKYLANEFIFYFSGSSNVYDAIKASKFWLQMSDEDGQVQSNYGNYVFYKKVGDSKYSQYEQCKIKLKAQPQSRRAVIRIMGYDHDMFGADFPCTFVMHFFIEHNKLNCVVSSRSTDVVRGLPYAMAFFCFINELLWKDLTENDMDIELGYTMMKCDFTQIYDKTSHLADQVLQVASQNLREPIWIPLIKSAHELLLDINKNLVLEGYKTGDIKSEVLQWCFENSK